MGQTRPRAKMVGWYDPPQLLIIAVRVAISTVFGEFADRQRGACDRATDRSGDESTRPTITARCNPARISGLISLPIPATCWNPTYAIARLLAEPALDLLGHRRASAARAHLAHGRRRGLSNGVARRVSGSTSRNRLVRLHVASSTERCSAPVRYPRQPRLVRWATSFVGLFCRRRNAGHLGRRTSGPHCRRAYYSADP